VLDVGVAFQKGALSLRLKMRDSFLPMAVRPMTGALVTWILGIVVFLVCGKLGVFGIGYGDLSDALNEKLAWKVAILLLLAKWVATIACYGSGGCGGIFSPCLFFGAMCGVAIAGASSLFLNLTESDRVLLAVGGMSACLGAVVQAPVTSILIIFEMTHQFALLPGLILAALLSQLVARHLLKENFYLEILTQDGHHMDHVIPPRDLRSWQQLPVSAIAHFEPVVIELDDKQLLHATLDKYPYDRFPVVKNGRLMGVLTRNKIKVFLEKNEFSELENCPIILPRDTVRKAEQMLIESDTGMIVIADKPEGMPLAVLTLHDLLRAQLTVAEREA
ncbi:MAG: chloride channel protein, partial [Chthoniobacterales bacterium]